LAKTNSESLNLALVRDEFDANTFDENLGNEQHVDENDESSSKESDEENMQAPFDTTFDVPVATGGEGNESNMPHLVVALCDVPTSSQAMSSTLMKMMNRQAKRAMKKTCRLHLTQLSMYR
jgi:hypothetical protein